MPQLAENRRQTKGKENGQFFHKKQVRQMPPGFQRLQNHVDVQYPSDLHDLQRKRTAESRLPQGGRGCPRGNPQGQLQFQGHWSEGLKHKQGAGSRPSTERKNTMAKNWSGKTAMFLTCSASADGHCKRQAGWICGMNFTQKQLPRLQPPSYNGQRQLPVDADDADDDHRWLEDSINGIGEKDKED